MQTDKMRKTRATTRATKPLTRAEVARRMRLLRKKKCADLATFAEEARIDRAGLALAEEGRRFLRLDRLQRYLNACGSSLTAFFRDIEEAADIPILPGYEENYRLMNEILLNGSDLYRQGLEATLRAMAEVSKNEHERQ